MPARDEICDRKKPNWLLISGEPGRSNLSDGGRKHKLHPNPSHAQASAAISQRSPHGRGCCLGRLSAHRLECHCLGLADVPCQIEAKLRPQQLKTDWRNKRQEDLSVFLKKIGEVAAWGQNFQQPEWATRTCAKTRSRSSPSHAKLQRRPTREAKFSWSALRARAWGGLPFYEFVIMEAHDVSTSNHPNDNLLGILGERAGLTVVADGRWNSGNGEALESLKPLS